MIYIYIYCSSSAGSIYIMFDKILAYSFIQILYPQKICVLCVQRHKKTIKTFSNGEQYYCSEGPFQKDWGSPCFRRNLCHSTWLYFSDDNPTGIDTSVNLFNGLVLQIKWNVLMIADQ